MIFLNIIAFLCLLSILVYLAYFFITYKQVPPSISQTAEFPHCYYGFQTVICFIFGYLQFYYPIIYPFSQYGYAEILLNAGCAGLALAGYYSYSPWEETKRDLFIHQNGSMIGGILLMLFYIIFLKWWIFVLTTMLICLILGYFIKGHGYDRPKDNSITFFVEIGIIIIVGTDILQRFISIF